MEKSSATGLWRAKWKGPCTDGQCCPSTPQLEMVIHWGGQRLGAEAQALEVRPGGEDWGWLHGDSLRGLWYGVPQTREYGRSPGPTREAGHHCSGRGMKR